VRQRGGSTCADALYGEDLEKELKREVVSAVSVSTVPPGGSVRIEPLDRAGRERLLRYCAGVVRNIPMSVRVLSVRQLHDVQRAEMKTMERGS
jgi:hypothetical protein